MTDAPRRPHYDERAFTAATRAIRDRIPPDVLADLRREHDALSWACNAWSEGQACCFADFFLDAEWGSDG